MQNWVRENFSLIAWNVFSDMTYIMANVYFAMNHCQDLQDCANSIHSIFSLDGPKRLNLHNWHWKSGKASPINCVACILVTRGVHTGIVGSGERMNICCDLSAVKQFDLQCIT